MRLMRPFTAVLFAGGVAVLASIPSCSDDPGAAGAADSGPAESSTPRPDSGGGVDSSIPDGGQDTGTGTDSGTDAGHDSGTDAGHDSGVDAGPSCGNGTVQSGEACDLGTALNTGAYGGCNANCTKAAFCGDGIVNGAANAEACDRGAANGALNACTTTCTQTNLLLWLAASDPNGNGVLPNDNDPLAAWVDKARARAVVQATAAQQPKWRTVGINAKPAFELDGVDDFFDADLDINGVLRPNLTVVVVFQNAAGNTSAFAGVWGHDDGGWDRFLGSGGTFGLNGISNGSSFTAVTGLTAEGVPLVVTTTLRGDVADMSTVHVNGVLSATFTGSIQPGATRMSVGNVNGPTSFASTHAFDGYIAEVRVYDAALADADRMALETLLIARYVP